jgi:hypothetical protein
MNDGWVPLYEAMEGVSCAGCGAGAPKSMPHGSVYTCPCGVMRMEYGKIDLTRPPDAGGAWTIRAPVADSHEN